MYPCTQCGACCKVAGRVPATFPTEDPTNIFYFPYKTDESGRCENLTEDNKCAVYDHRPLICNMDLFIEVTQLDKIKFYNENIAYCNQLMDEQGVPIHFRINDKV